MIKHYMSLKGYVILFLALYFLMTTVANIVLGLTDRFIVELPHFLVLGIKLIIIVAAAVLSSGRFLTIEQRVPTPRERDVIALIGFLVIAGLMVLVALIVVGGGMAAQMNPEMSGGNAPSSKDMMETAISATAITIASFASLFLFFGPLAKMRQVP